MITINLHGHLKALHPHEIKVHATSVGEALTSLSLIPAFDPQKGKQHQVTVVGYYSESAIMDKIEGDLVIDILPVILGSGGGGFGQILFGALLVAVSFIPGVGPAVAGFLFKAGAMMILGGLLQMLAPQPKFEGTGVTGDDQRSKYLGASKNTVAIGTHIPLIYGRAKAFGHYISFDVDAGELNKAPAQWYISPFTNIEDYTYGAVPTLNSELMPPPEIVDKEPLSTFDYILSVDGVDYIGCDPAVPLTAGEWDITFNNGRTLHVFCSTTGNVSQLEILGGQITNLPAKGTPIVFTQNYE